MLSNTILVPPKQILCDDVYKLKGISFFYNLVLDDEIVDPVIIYSLTMQDPFIIMQSQGTIEFSFKAKISPGVKSS